MSEPVLSVRSATYRYPGAATDVLHPIDLDVSAGDSIGIVGESGSGKSTLARLLVGLADPSSGEVLVEGAPWRRVSRRDRRRRDVQMVFQDPFGSLNPGLTPLQTIAEVIEVTQRAPRAQAIGRARDLLAEMGLGDDHITRFPARLSGGQRQRVGIARAIAANPRVLVADEPTSALDASVQSQILSLLRRLREQHDFALVFISHDLAVIRNMTERVIVMQHGTIVEDGFTADVFDHPAEPYTRALIASIPGRRGDHHVA